MGSRGARPGRKGVAPQEGACTPARVGPERLDRLIDLAGELTLAHAALSRLVGRGELPRMSATALALEELRSLSRDLQDGLTALRTQPQDAHAPRPTSWPSVGRIGWGVRTLSPLGETAP